MTTRNGERPKVERRRAVTPRRRAAVLAPAVLAALLGLPAAGAADEIRDRARRLILDSFVVDGNLNPALWQEDTACSPSSRLDCWPRNSVESFAVIRDEVGVDLLSTSVNTATDASRAVRRVLTSNDIDEARWANHVGVLRYIQRPDAVDVSWVAEPGANVDTLASRRAQSWFDDGLRIVQLAYSRRDNDKRLFSATFDSRYGGGANEDNGIDASGPGPCGGTGDPPCVLLTPLGRRLVDALLDRFMIIDLSHVGRDTALAVAAIAKARNRPVLANHANARAVFADSVSRNHDDKVICAIANTGGVIGVTPVRFMLSNSPLNTAGKWNNRGRLVEHLNHMRDLDCRDDAGRRIRMVEHIAVASDSYVNGFPSRMTWLNTRGFNDRDRWMDLAELMIRHHGYSDPDIRRIFGANLMRVYRAALPGLTRPEVTRPAHSDEPRVSRSLRVTWSPPVAQGVAPASRYDVHLYRRSAAGKRRSMTVVSAGSGTDIRLSGLLANTRYSLFVRARNGTQRVNSEWVDFRTGD